ncbi:50S ribosomal protein L15 [Williamwhitmania taraxaci]|uniref:Large ribosomal subunit protein uL15 n=1 Tax=Williamwhitmania taraxaci TaxID=1640674 RepID=A0A1G6HCI6_9BACT|nr:50S ribosomal protein L15 [Williamwhitmania taraxaci]SDB91864.1 LSU ribosomal protein L15P [Williamwhitmania taraxaci]
MELSNLKPAKGSTHKVKRIGRGQGSGHGGTSTRGHKGAKSRSGYSKKVGFEGGQMPIQRRLPKFGFKNPFRKEYKGINIGLIDEVAKNMGLTVITKEVLVEAGLVSRNQLYKVLGSGELTTKVEVHANAFSGTAIKAIESLQGNVVKL